MAIIQCQRGEHGAYRLDDIEIAELCRARECDSAPRANDFGSQDFYCPQPRDREDMRALIVSAGGMLISFFRHWGLGHRLRGEAVWRKSVSLVVRTFIKSIFQFLKDWSMRHVSRI